MECELAGFVSSEDFYFFGISSKNESNIWTASSHHYFFFLCFDFFSAKCGGLLPTKKGIAISLFNFPQWFALICSVVITFGSKRRSEKRLEPVIFPLLVRISKLNVPKSSYWFFNIHDFDYLSLFVLGGNLFNAILFRISLAPATLGWCLYFQDCWNHFGIAWAN